MNKLNYSLTKINTNDKQYIRAAETIWEDGLKMGERVAFVEVQPELAEKNLAKFEKGELTLTFGSEILIAGVPQGIFRADVSKATVATEATLEHA
jgi:hypothetical protein